MKEKRCFKGIKLSKRKKVILLILFIIASIPIVYSVNKKIVRMKFEDYFGSLYEAERDLVYQIIESRSIDIDNLMEGIKISEVVCTESGKVSFTIKYPNEKELNESIKVEISNGSVKTTSSDFSSKEAFVEYRLSEEWNRWTRYYFAMLFFTRSCGFFPINYPFSKKSFIKVKARDIVSGFYVNKKRILRIAKRW